MAIFVCSSTLLLVWRLKNEQFGLQTSNYENVEILSESPKGAKMAISVFWKVQGVNFKLGG